jgi:flavin-dependent thymidylate synthase
MKFPFLSAPPKVKLLNALTFTPQDNTRAAAKTCYSDKLLTEKGFQKRLKEAGRKERIGLIKERSSLIDDLYDSGHHTTFEHNTFQFSITQVSRAAIHSFLHSHPFYNSEQQSQRFAPIDTNSFTVPNISGGNLELYRDTLHLQIGAFESLQEILFKKAKEAYEEIFQGRKGKYDSSIAKKAQEIARYVLPIAMHSKLHHTINEMTLLRLNRLSNQPDFPLEQRLIVEGMMSSLEERGIELGDVVEDPIEGTDMIEYSLMELHRGQTSTREFFREFDSYLNGKRSVLEGYNPNAEFLLANAVRGVVGISSQDLSDKDAIAFALDSNKNPYLSEKMNVNPHSRLMRALLAVNYTFRKKLSHTADSQSQRHRTMPGIYPILGLNIGDEPDVIVPSLIEADQEALDLFMETNQTTWRNIQKLIGNNVSVEQASYLLPNAKAIRKWESGSLVGLLHKQNKRLCYNAQEEIWRLARDEATEIKEVHPEIGQYFGAPCDLRFSGKVTPYCSEGPRYCGVPVWRLSEKQRKRVI